MKKGITNNENRKTLHGNFVRDISVGVHDFLKLANTP